MIPFRLAFRPGIPVHEQATFAAKKAILSGRMRPGDAFPSVRALSKALKINPNTAHKVVAQLTQEGLLEVRPGLGTIVAERQLATHADRGRLLEHEIDELTVEAKKVGLTLEELQAEIAKHWRALEGEEER